MAGSIRKCYGCGQAFSERYRNAPNDLVLKRYDHCARKKNSQFEFRYILIHNEIKQNLSPEHKLLLDSLGIQH